jgi:hypothetical protein
VRITVANRASESASIVVLPILWFRNTGRGVSLTKVARASRVFGAT